MRQILRKGRAEIDPDTLLEQALTADRQSQFLPSSETGQCPGQGTVGCRDKLGAMASLFQNRSRLLDLVAASPCFSVSRHSVPVSKALWSCGHEALPCE